MAEPYNDWERYVRYLVADDSLGLTLDISRMRFEDSLFAEMQADMDRAYEDMAALEDGAIANPSEQRQVGHYWLRAPNKAPTKDIREAIVDARNQVLAFASEVHSGRIRPERAEAFTDVLLIGVGGSSLGPRLVADALGDPGHDRLRPWFLDNSDPDGMERLLQALGSRLQSTLTIVASKSGSTREALNGMAVIRSAYESENLEFSAHAVAITGEGSQLDQLAEQENWIARFPVWEWVGGRTSVFSPVGLVPAALQGITVEDLLAGAAACDDVTRRTDTRSNPAALLALMWLSASAGRAQRNMVVLPYKDNLELFSRYLQQLVMESLGKKFDLSGNVVHQGLTVYGNKGSTDQHAYVQQLREGPDRFFVTFIEVLEYVSEGFEVKPGIGVGDYLRGFLYGTREALWEAGRQSITLTLRRVDPFHLGVLIALYERAVGFYGSLIRVNAYDQPGVEVGKKAAAGFIDLQTRLLQEIDEQDGPQNALGLARAIGKPQAVESVFQTLRSLAAQGRCNSSAGEDPQEVQFGSFSQNQSEHEPGAGQ